MPIIAAIMTDLTYAAAVLILGSQGVHLNAQAYVGIGAGSIVIGITVTNLMWRS